MAYTQPNSPFKQTTNGNINITSKILTKAEAAQAKAEEREEVKQNKKNKKNKKKKSSPQDGMVKMPWDGKQAEMVKLPGIGGGNPLDGMTKF